jgi:enamine deaminase RidA (YjgF/YER057c/UK114 family)
LQQISDSRRALAALALLAVACAPAGSPPGGAGPMAGPAPSSMAPVYLNPPSVPQLPGFSSGVKVGLTVWVAGQVAVDSAGAIVGGGDVTAQLRQALANVVTVVRAGRGVPGDVVRLTVYHVAGSDSAVAAGLRAAAADWFAPGEYPAATLVAVQRLPMPGLLVAVDAVAELRSLLPDRQRDRGAR